MEIEELEEFLKCLKEMQRHLREVNLLNERIRVMSPGIYNASHINGYYNLWANIQIAIGNGWQFDQVIKWAQVGIEQLKAPQESPT